MTKYTEEQWFGLARYLSECGCPLQMEHYLKVIPVGLCIEQLPNAGVNLVFDLNDGRSGYVMDMNVTNKANRPIRSSDVRITTSWGARVSLLPDSLKADPANKCYDFPGESLTFDKSVVLNDFLSGQRILNPGARISGLLLGIDEGPLPNNFSEHGLTVIELSISDERGNKFSSKFSLCFDRSATLGRERKEKATAGSQSKFGRSNKWAA